MTVAESRAEVSASDMAREIADLELKHEESLAAAMRRLEDVDSSRRQLEHDMEERLKDAEVMGFLRIQSLSYPP